MTVFFLRRLLQAVIVLFVVSVLVFTGVFAIGDPVKLLIDPRATSEEIATVRENLGLDRPLYEQYFHFVSSALHGDFGKSFIHNVPALKLILDRFPATFELAFCAILMTIVLGIPLGMWAGLRPDSWAGRLILSGSILGFSLPSFWVGIMLIMFFSIRLGWLPTMGRGETVQIFGMGFSMFTLDGLRHLLLPALNLGLFSLALVIRLTRAGVQETWALDYVKFARAKGLSFGRVVLVHVLKNIMIPIVTILGLEFGTILAFAVVTESVFAWPGMGKLIIDSLKLLDRPVIVAYILFIVFIFIIINLCVDLLYAVLDPRIRLDSKDE